MTDEEKMEERRRTDAVATAVAIESVRGDIKALAEKVGGFSDLMNQQIKELTNDNKVVNHSLRDIENEFIARVRETENTVANKFIEVKAELMTHITNHKTDSVPHSDSIGMRVASLETSRTYMKGMIAVGALLMPAFTGLVFKWLGLG